MPPIGYILLRNLLLQTALWDTCQKFRKDIAKEHDHRFI